MLFIVIAVLSKSAMPDEGDSCTVLTSKNDCYYSTVVHNHWPCKFGNFYSLLVIACTTFNSESCRIGLLLFLCSTLLYQLVIISAVLNNESRQMS
jgi:hypothetical protein